MRQYRNICIEASCNLCCSYCGGSNVKINEEVVINNLEKVFSRFDPNSSCFKVECLGEITLYPGIIEYLEEKAETGYVIEILSNGTKTNTVVKSDTKLKWIISLDGHTIEMNRERNLNESQVANILDTILLLNAEIQCVYYNQTIDEMNSFIEYLAKRDYKGFLHIFPYRDNKPLNVYIDYEKLLKTKFIPDYEYFRRWKYIYDNKKRDFTCDFFKNGYVYRISSEGIKMIKCDCSSGSFRYEHPFENEKEYKVFPCGTCINHFEYNNTRKIVNE